MSRDESGSIVLISYSDSDVTRVLKGLRMSRVLQGIVHGRQVELTEDPGVPDGERVEVILRAKPSQQVWGDGIRRSAGAGADAPGFDEAFEEIERERRSAAYRNGSE